MRHAEAVPERRGCSDREVPVTAEGFQCARQAGLALYERFGAFDIVAYSGYLRSRETAFEIFSSFPGREQARVAVVEEPLLDERDRGAVFGLTDEEVAERFPWLAEHRETLGEVHACYPKGESLIAVFLRVDVLAKERLPFWAGRKVCLVGHWGTHFALLRKFGGLDDRELLDAMGSEHPPHCSITVFRRHPGAKTLSLCEKNLVLVPGAR